MRFWTCKPSSSRFSSDMVNAVPVKASPTFTFVPLLCDALCPAISLEFTSGAITVSAALRHAWITGQTQKRNRYRDEYQAEAQMQTLLHWCNGAGNDRFDIIRRTTPPSQRIQHKRDMLYSRYGKEGAQLSPGWRRQAWLAP